MNLPQILLRRHSWTSSPIMDKDHEKDKITLKLKDEIMTEELKMIKNIFVDVTINKSSCYVALIFQRHYTQDYP